MLRNKFLLFLGFLLIGFSSCDDGLVELNVDPNNPTAVPADNLITQAQFALANRLWSRGYNAEWTMLMVQHWAQNEYTEESRYSGMDGTDFDTEWIDMYAGVLNELQVAADMIEMSESIPAGQRANQLAIINVLRAFAYQTLTDAYGDIPFTQALNSVDFPLPQYDAQETVYKGILEMLDNAGSSIVEGDDSFSGDVIYGGDMSKWKKFAYSLMARAAMRISDVDGATASTYLQKAEGKMFTSNDDNALFVFDANPDIANPLFVDAEINNRDDFAVSELFVNTLQDNDDPRLEIFVAPTLTGEFVGMPYGLTDGAAFALKATTSRPAAGVRAATAPAILMDFAEVNFIMAEAIERGIYSGDAEDAYKAGIRASMEYWGVADDMAISDFIDDNGYDSGNWKESIGIQKWIAFYMNGPQAWAEWRRLDYPELSASADAENGGMIPVRLPYPISEQTRNGTALGGVTGTPDDLNTRLWWDVN